MTPGLPKHANRPGGEGLYASWLFLLLKPLEAILAALERRFTRAIMGSALKEKKRADLRGEEQKPALYRYTLTAWFEKRHV